MNVLFVHLDFNALGGAEQYVRDIVSGWVDAGNEASLVSRSGSSSRICGRIVTVLEPGQGWAARIARKVQRALGARHLTSQVASHKVAKLTFDGVNLVVCGHLHVLPESLAIAQRYSVPTVLITYGIDIWRDWTPAEHDMIAQCDVIVALSTYTAASVERRLGSSSAIAVIHPGVDTRFFEESPLPTETEGMRLLTVARLDANEKYKGHDLVLDALATLRRRGRSITYDVVGDGSDRLRLEALARTLGVQDCVVFHGSAKGERLLRHYRDSSLFVMPSYVSVREDGRWTGEGFGIVYAEAGACGRASIGCNVGGQCDIILDHATGRLVAPSSVEIADAIDELFRDRGLNAAYAKSAAKRVRQLFSYDVFHSRWNQLLLSFNSTATPSQSPTMETNATWQNRLEAE